jgi:hypothetical protein
VVESSLSAPIDGVDCVNSIGICLDGNEWIKEWTLLRTT